MNNPQEKKDHSASEHCSLFFNRQTGSSQYLVERYLTVYERCTKMEMRDDSRCSRKAVDIITNSQDHGVFKTS